MQMGLSNMGGVMGSYMYVALLWIMGGVESPAFDNVEWFVGFRSLTRLLPLFLIPFLVPGGSPQDDSEMGSANPQNEQLLDEDEGQELTVA